MTDDRWPMADGRQWALRNVDGDRDGDGAPVEHELGVVAVDEREVEGERFHLRGDPGRDVDGQQVLVRDAEVLRVKRRMRLVEDDGPLLAARLRPDGVGPRGERLALDG